MRLWDGVYMNEIDEILDEYFMYEPNKDLSYIKAKLNKVAIPKKVIEEKINYIEGKRITDNNDYVTFPITFWNKFRQELLNDGGKT
jgi:hypothetical protein